MDSWEVLTPSSDMESYTVSPVVLWCLDGSGNIVPATADSLPGVVSGTPAYRQVGADTVYQQGGEGYYNAGVWLASLRKAA
jgi:hypothetical protein